MNSLPTQAIFGAGIVALTAVAATFGSLPLAIGFVSSAAVVAMAHVAFAAQSGRLRDEKRFVYRPVYVRHHDMRRRITSDD